MDHPKCANSCGFYGSVETKNLCSVCYEDYLKKENVRANTESVAAVSVDNLDLMLSSLSSLRIAPHESLSNDDCGSSDGVKNKNRCQSCKKKVGLLGFQCRCGYVFCRMHRYPESHPCLVDYKKIGRDVLAKQNPLCKGDKLESRV